MVERALSGLYSLIVLDVMLPGINGFEVLRRIRAVSAVCVSTTTSENSVKAIPKLDKQQPPTPEQKTAQQTTLRRSEEPTQQIQPPPAPPPENPDKLVQPINTRVYGAFWQYADHLGSYLVATIIAAALTWYGFFKYSTLPLRRLRRVTQQLAGGDLSARVGEGLPHRKNEVVELGRDVDRMAERIESLVGAHQRLIRDVSHELRSPLMS